MTDRGFPSLKPLLRSLLQKAARRGARDVVETVAGMLAQYGDSAWLHARIAVIGFEECWPQMQSLRGPVPALEVLSKVAQAVKNKEAAGLGSLAHAASQGDATAIGQAPEPVAVKIVVAGISRPEAFFEWALRQCKLEQQERVVRTAQQYLPRASWPWDKAFMLAGAYLACSAPVPELHVASKSGPEPFPLWVAVDKHTPPGKAALRSVAGAMQVPLVQLEWASFYEESARCNEVGPQVWWAAEVDWRLRQIGLSREQARSMWTAASLEMQLAVEESTFRLETVLADYLNRSGLDRANA